MHAKSEDGSFRAGKSPPPLRLDNTPPLFHYAGTCVLGKENATGGFDQVLVPEAYDAHGLLGCVILSQGTKERQVLVYDKEKKGLFSTTIHEFTVDPYLRGVEGGFFTLKDEEGAVWSVGFRSEAEVSSFGIQLILARHALTQPNDSILFQDISLGAIAGDSAVVEPGCVINVRFVIWLVGDTGRGSQGKIVHSNSDPSDESLEFVQGLGMVMAGLEEGVQWMSRGAKRRIIVPPSMGYARVGLGDKIPPKATLIMEILVEAVRLCDPATLQHHIRTKGQNALPPCTAPTASGLASGHSSPLMQKRLSGGRVSPLNRPNSPQRAPAAWGAAGWGQIQVMLGGDSDGDSMRPGAVSPTHSFPRSQLSSWDADNRISPLRARPVSPRGWGAWQAGQQGSSGSFGSLNGGMGGSVHPHSIQQQQHAASQNSLLNKQTGGAVGAGGAAFSMSNSRRMSEMSITSHIARMSSHLASGFNDDLTDEGDCAEGSAPTFMHMSTCRLQRREKGGELHELDVPSYPNKKLGFVVMRSGDGNPKLVAYAPILQASLSDTVLVSGAGSDASPFSYVAKDEVTGQEFVMTLSGEKQLSRFEKQIGVARDMLSQEAKDPVINIIRPPAIRGSANGGGGAIGNGGLDGESGTRLGAAGPGSPRLSAAMRNQSAAERHRLSAEGSGLFPPLYPAALTSTTEEKQSTPSNGELDTAPILMSKFHSPLDVDDQMAGNSKPKPVSSMDEVDVVDMGRMSRSFEGMEDLTVASSGEGEGRRDSFRSDQRKASTGSSQL
uniref:peptidylprolyl isomerase n=1 Tax=Hemiselmis andersenii TaxID=464988 RepID=A0A6U5C1W7_HEMAN